MQAKPVALVTGCSSGIGLAAVPALAAKGWHVVASARNLSRIQDLRGDGVECIALDVTDEAGRGAAVEHVLERHGRLDALVNNAGFGATLAAEDTDLDLMRRMFETNVFGAHDLARLVLPTMRQQRSGRIVNVASIAAHISVPFMGSYCATKFALRALTQAMDNEVRSHGIRALLVEPGVIRTEFGSRSQVETEHALDAPHRLGGPYGRQYQAWLDRRLLARGADPSLIARRIVAACDARYPRFHHFAPLSAKAANIAKRALPDAWVSWGMRRYFE